MNMNKIYFNRRLAGNAGLYRLGTAFKNDRGWKFYPHVAGRRPSAKFHVTWEACLPRWVGYPDACESEFAPDVTARVSSALREFFS